MRIAELTAYHAAIRLKQTIRHASQVRKTNDTLLVRCRLDDGTEGWGEGLPRPYVTGETIESAFEQLRQTDWRSQLAMPVQSLSEAVELAKSLQLAELPGKEFASRNCRGNSVRCAVELSILDAFTRREIVPLGAIVERVPETCGIRQSRSAVRYSAVMPHRRFAWQVIEATAVRLAGFRQCKFKVGISPEDDERALKRVRRLLGKRVELRIDANESWSVDRMTAAMPLLQSCGVRSVEQPLPHTEIEQLKQTRGQFPVAVVLDESLCSRRDAEESIHWGWGDLWNLRLSKCGGFLRTLELAALAYRSGIEYQLGCQVGESPVLSAAGRHFACAVDGLVAVEGSFDRYLLQDRVAGPDMTFGWGGQAPALTGPGLGVSVDHQAVRRLAGRVEHWNFS